MKLNKINELTGDNEKDELLLLANRMKHFRLIGGHHDYEKFALGNGIARMQYRNYELGANITYKSLMRVLRALKVTPAEFFSEGFENVKSGIAQ